MPNDLTVMSTPGMMIRHIAGPPVETRLSDFAVAPEVRRLIAEARARDLAVARAYFQQEARADPEAELQRAMRTIHAAILERCDDDWIHEIFSGLLSALHISLD